MEEQCVLIELINEYQERTGKTWGIAEQRMKKICDTFDYTFTFNEQGNICVNMMGISEVYNGKSIYEFFGKNFHDKEQFIDHREYTDAQEMVNDWTGECKRLNEQYLSKGNDKAFDWV